MMKSIFLDGINEYGLSVQKLTFANGARLTQPDINNTQLHRLNYPIFIGALQIDCGDWGAHGWTSADEWRTRLKRYGYPELHYVAADITGRIVAIETSAKTA